MKILNQITKDQYISMEGLSRSGIKEFIKGPNHYHKYINKPMKETPSMMFGTALHEYILAPDTFNEKYIFAPEGMKFNTKDGIEFKKSNAGFIVLNYDQSSAIKAQGELIGNHKRVQELMDGALREPCAVWQDSETGVMLKSMPDLVSEKLGIISDLKTIAFFDDYNMRKAIKSYALDIQGAMSLEAFNHCNKFMLIFLSKQDPFELRIIKLMPEELLSAFHQYKAILPEYKFCKENDVWPSRQPIEEAELSVFMQEPMPTEEDYEGYYND